MFLFAENKVRTWNLIKYNLKYNQKHEILKDIFLKYTQEMYFENYNMSLRKIK